MTGDYLMGTVQARISVYQCLLYLSPDRCAPETNAGSGGPIHRCTWRRFGERAELDTGAWWGYSWRCRHRQVLPGSGAVSQTGHAAGLHLGGLRNKIRTEWEQNSQILWLNEREDICSTVLSTTKPEHQCLIFYIDIDVHTIVECVLQKARPHFFL